MTDFDMRSARADAWWDSMRLRADTDWRNRSQCRGIPADMVTKHTCAGCPVAAACLADELIYCRDNAGWSTAVWFYIRGGLNVNRRRKLVAQIERHRPGRSTRRNAA